jgi:hypothetical protein
MWSSSVKNPSFAKRSNSAKVQCNRGTPAAACVVNWILVIALGRHGNQLPPDQLDSVFLGEDAELSQSLELGERPS